TRKRDRLQVEHLGKLRLLEAFVPVDPRQHSPLRARDSELPRALVGIGLQQTSYVHDHKGEFAFDGLCQHDGPLMLLANNKQAYNKHNMSFPGVCPARRARVTNAWVSGRVADPRFA